MFEKEVLIASLRHERDTLKDLIAELEAKPNCGDVDQRYCEEVLKRIETTIRRMRKSGLVEAV